MQQLFMNNNHIIYTEKVSDEEYAKKILYCVPSESLIPYYDDIAEAVLTEHFDVVKCPNKHIWHGEWNNHRRMVIKLHMFYSYEIRFGYNYDFIPILNRKNKFVYHRTEKSVDLDVMDVYFNHISYIPDNMTNLESFNVRRKYQLPTNAGVQELDFAKQYIENVIRTNITFMKEFYENYESDEDMIHFLEHTIQKGNIFQKYRYIWTKAFLYAKLQDMDKAMLTMGEYYQHGNQEIPGMVIEKLNAVKEMFG
ncbi:MAG: hypothetical protein IJA32_13265 [Lachnospiraceae bacterium]|nr:hypothetical protein [Lachnospiraceae bacterium]